MGERFIEELACSGCTQTGHATWLKNAKNRRELVGLSDGFGYRPYEGRIGVMVVTCGICGLVQPDQLAE
jgi:hypothetical protein